MRAVGVHRSTNTWNKRASGPPIIPQLSSRKNNKTKTSVTHLPSRCHKMGFFWLPRLFFSPNTKLYFDMQVLHSIVANKSASLSPRRNSLTACIIHMRLWAWGGETGDAAAENTAAVMPQISLGTSFDCSFTAAKTHLNTSGNVLNPGGS